MTAARNDARLWATLIGEFRTAGADGAQAELLARRAVAAVRREATHPKARTFAPGDEIPYDVTRVFDLDGDVWERQGQPPDTLKDTWNMKGFDPAEHEGAAGGAWITPWLLERYGPLTEIPPAKARQATGGKAR
jgi:hypothetical protein